MVPGVAGWISIYRVEALFMRRRVLVHKWWSFHLFVEIVWWCWASRTVEKVGCCSIWLNLILIIFSIGLGDMVIFGLEICLIPKYWWLLDVDLCILSSEQVTCSFCCVVTWCRHTWFAQKPVSRIIAVVLSCPECLSFGLVQFDGLMMFVRTMSQYYVQFLGAHVLGLVSADIWPLCVGLLRRITIIDFILIWIRISGRIASGTLHQLAVSWGALVGLGRLQDFDYMSTYLIFLFW